MNTKTITWICIIVAILACGAGSMFDSGTTIDKITGSLVTIGFGSYKIHEGNHYYIEGFTELGVDGVLYVKMVTPELPARVHIRWEIESSGVLETYFYEGVSDGMAGGSSVIPWNNDRNSTNTSTVVLTSGVDVATNLGEMISKHKVGGTGFKTVSGGSADRSDELLLKPDTIYLRKFLSKSASNIIAFKATWCEL